MNQPLSNAVHARTAAPPSRTGGVTLRARRAPDGRSFIAHQHATYPFHICRPHYVAGDPAGMATMYLQSVSGGIFEHDRLTMDVTVEEAAALHLTSQGSTIIHSMTEGYAQVLTKLSVGENAVVEILPEATILFPGACLETALQICAHESAVVCLGEGFINHDPADDGRVFGRFLSDVAFLSPDARIIAHDRQAAEGQAFAGMSISRDTPYTTYGGLYLWAPGRGLVSLQANAEEELAKLPGIYAGASLLPNDCGLNLRILAVDGASLRMAWVTAWQSLRQGLFGTAPAQRRK